MGSEVFSKYETEIEIAKMIDIETDLGIITSSNYPLRVELENPHPLINLSFARYQISTGQKTQDQIEMNCGVTYTGYSGTGYIYGLISSTNNYADGIEFDFYGGFALRVLLRPSGTHKFKVFIDDEFIEEVQLANADYEWDCVYSYSATNNSKHRAKIYGSFGSIMYDCIDVFPSNIQTIQNEGLVDSCPIIEVESLDTTIKYHVLGKIPGDINHPITIYSANSTDPLSIDPLTYNNFELSQASYDILAFLNNNPWIASTTLKNNYRFTLVKYDLTKKGFEELTIDEIISGMKSYIGKYWMYGEGAITQNNVDPSFETGLNEFLESPGVTVARSSDWSSTGTYSLKIMADGSTDFARPIKELGDLSGKKIKVRVKIYSPDGAENVNMRLYDETNGVWLTQSGVIHFNVEEEKNIELLQDIPETCQNLKLYIYPSYGVAEAKTIYIDDVSILAYGVELYLFGSSTEWSHLYMYSHQENFPSYISFYKSAWLDNFIVDGKIYFLIKSMYPSDGITPSSIYIDSLQQDVTYNIAKLNSNFIVNKANNLLPPLNEWGLNVKARIKDDYYLEHYPDTVGDSSNIRIYDILPNATYYMAGETNAKIRFVTFDEYDNIISMQDLAGSSSIIVSTESNCKYARVYLRTTVNGLNYWKNFILTSLEQKFLIQNKQNINLDTILNKDKRLILDFKNQDYNINEITIINPSFPDYKRLQIIGHGTNHLYFSHIGGNIQIKLTYPQTETATSQKYIKSLTINEKIKQIKVGNRFKTQDKNYTFEIEHLYYGVHDFNADDEYRIKIHRINEDTLKENIEYLTGVKFDNIITDESDVFVVKELSGQAINHIKT